MITLWAFGTTQGLEHHSFNPSFDTPIDRDWTVISGMEFHEKIPTVFVQRISRGSYDLTWIGVYKAVFEVGYQRLGGYYGAGAWLKGSVVDTRLLISILFEIQDLILRSAIQNGQFQCQLKEVVSLITPNSNSLIALMKTMAPQSAGSGLNSKSRRQIAVPSGEKNADLINLAFFAKPAQSFRSVCIVPTVDHFNSWTRSKFQTFNNFADFSQTLVSEVSNDNERLYQQLHVLKQGLIDDEAQIEKRDEKIRELERNIQELKFQNESLERALVHLRSKKKKIVNFKNTEFEDQHILTQGAQSNSANYRPKPKIASIIENPIPKNWDEDETKSSLETFIIPILVGFIAIVLLLTKRLFSLDWDPLLDLLVWSVPMITLILWVASSNLNIDRPSDRQSKIVGGILILFWGIGMVYLAISMFQSDRPRKILAPSFRSEGPKAPPKSKYDTQSSIHKEDPEVEEQKGEDLKNKAD